MMVKEPISALFAQVFGSRWSWIGWDGFAV